MDFVYSKPSYLMRTPPIIVKVVFELDAPSTLTEAISRENCPKKSIPFLGAG